MTRKIKVEVYLDLETQDTMTDSEVASLVQNHVTNCLMDNPDADGSAITFADVRVA